MNKLLSEEEEGGEEERPPDLDGFRLRLSEALARGDISRDELATIELVELRGEYWEWERARGETIRRLRDIAEYIDSVSKKAGEREVDMLVSLMLGLKSVTEMLFPSSIKKQFQLQSRIK